eukprot:3316172-Pyramimonas_sp.AAC.1
MVSTRMGATTDDPRCLQESRPPVPTTATSYVVAADNRLWLARLLVLFGPHPPTKGTIGNLYFMRVLVCVAGLGPRLSSGVRCLFKSFSPVSQPVSQSISPVSQSSQSICQSVQSVGQRSQSVQSASP